MDLNFYSRVESQEHKLCYSSTNTRSTSISLKQNCTNRALLTFLSCLLLLLQALTEYSKHHSQQAKFQMQILLECFTFHSGGLGFARSFFAEPMWCTNEVGGMVKGQGQPGGDQEFARCFFAEQVMRYVLRSGIDGEGIRGCTGEVE